MFQVLDQSKKDIKLAGRSKATVVDTRDPLKRGRIRVDHPILGKTVWIDYINEANSFNPPKIGDVVYVECDAGWQTHPIAHGRAIKGLDENPDLPSTFKREVPTNRGLYSPGGHLLELDDGVAPLTQNPQDTNSTSENKGLRITSSGGNKIHVIEDVDNGNTFILIQDAGGNLIKLDYKNNELTIKSVGKTTVITAEDKTESVGGNFTINVEGNATVNTNGNVTVSAEGTAEFKGSGGTTVGDSGASTNVDGSQVLLAGGGPGVARLGDRAFGIGNMGAPVSSTIIQGSSKVLSG